MGHEAIFSSLLCGVLVVFFFLFLFFNRALSEQDELLSLYILFCSAGSALPFIIEKNAVYMPFYLPAESRLQMGGKVLSLVSFLIFLSTALLAHARHRLIDRYT